jgi:divalent metal cation (Fe/Co/Zn/Cd) transporter/predicted small metal-binding protein
MELVNDELGLLAALVGTLFIIEGEYLADPIAAIVVATIIAVNAVGLFRENFNMLMGGHPGRKYLREIEERVRAVKGVLGLHDLRIEYLGPDQVHVDLHIVVRRGLLVEDADAISEEVCGRVQKFTGSKYCVVHLDTAGGDGAGGDSMASFECKDLGMKCGWKASAPSEAELLPKIAEHEAGTHNIKQIEPAMVERIKAAIKR